MGNSSSASFPQYICFAENLSRNSVTPEYWTPPSEFRDVSLATGVVMLLFCLIGLPSNFIIIVSILKQKLYKLPTHILLLNLVISDFLLCFLYMPFTVIASFAGSYIFGSSDYTRCRLCEGGLIFTALTFFSVWTLGLISVDRFIYIKFPFSYEKTVTKVRTVITVIVVWLLSIFVALLPLAGFGQIIFSYTLETCLVNLFGETPLTRNINYMIFLIALGVIPVIIIVITNIWIVYIARKQIRKVYDLTSREDNRERKQIQKVKNKKQVALLKVFGGILIANFITWTPVIIYSVVSIVVSGDNVPLWVLVFVFGTFIMHSVLHPFVEGIFIPDIRNTFKKVFSWKKISCKSGTNNSESQTGNRTLQPDSEDGNKICCTGCLQTCYFVVIPESWKTQRRRRN